MDVFDEFKMYPGRCRCFEKQKPLASRSLTIRSYYPERVWGRACRRYDGRKLLIVMCNRCHRTWKDYRRNSPLWKLMGDDPYKGPEKVTVINGGEKDD